MTNQLFSADTDWYNNACLNLSHDSMVFYINGYKKAADILVIESRQDQDILVYPIAFLYRQYIELQLKSIIRDSKFLLEKGSGFPEHHKIKKLWNEANVLMGEIISTLDKSVGEYITNKDMERIGCIIKDFVEIDSESFAFRYPDDKKGNKNLEGLTHINLRKLGQQIGLLSEKLDKYNLVVVELIGRKEELQAKYEEEMKYRHG